MCFVDPHPACSNDYTSASLKIFEHGGFSYTILSWEVRGVGGKSKLGKGMLFNNTPL